MTRLILALAGLLGFSARCFAQQTVVIQCPERIEIAQRVNQPVVSPWQAIDRSGIYPFATVSMYSGHPLEKVELAPNDGKKTKSGEVAIWFFYGADEKWISCDYNSADASVAMKLDADIASCAATYDPKYSFPVVKKIECTRGERRGFTARK